MELTDKEFKRIALIVGVILLGVLVFFLLKPILISILGGLILAYIFFPLYNLLVSRLKSKSLSATIALVILIAIIIIPVWLATPLIIEQVFSIFKYSQTADFSSLITNFFPSSSEQFITQMTVTLNGLISKLTSQILTSMTNLFLNIVTLTLHLFVVAFVFFFALRDSERLKTFISGLSPLTKAQEDILVRKFKEITNSVIYGHIIVGIGQGLVAGIALYLFGIPNALVLTILAIIFSMVPVLGPGFIWIPAAVYLFISGHNTSGIIYLIYNIIITTPFDSIARSYLVSRYSDLDSVFVLVGMVGGFFIFGIVGFILGPLILAYFITFLKAYKDKTLTSLFSHSK
jgi:predicted PurR-regulated permease PerM